MILAMTNNKLNMQNQTVTIRQAADKIFAEEPYILPASNIHAWMVAGIFVPYEKAPKPRSRHGCKLSKSDLVYLSVLRAMFLAGARFKLFTSLHFDRHGLSGDDCTSLLKAKEEGRGPQCFFEITKYDAYVHIWPSAYARKEAGEIIWFVRKHNIDDEFRDVTAEVLRAHERLNLEPHSFVNVRAHEEYIDRRLSHMDLK